MLEIYRDKYRTVIVKTEMALQISDRKMDQLINGAWTIGYPCGKRHLIPHSKIKFRWIKDLDVKAKLYYF